MAHDKAEKKGFM